MSRQCPCMIRRTWGLGRAYERRGRLHRDGRCEGADDLVDVVVSVSG